MKKLIALLLAFIMAFSVAPVAFAAGENADPAAAVTAVADDADTENYSDTKSSDEPVFGDLKITEQEIKDFINNPPPGVSSKFVFKLAKIFFKIAVVFHKLHLTPIANALLKMIANWFKGLWQEQEPAETVTITADRSDMPYYVNKGDKVTLKLNISVEPEADATHIVIGGKQYKLTKTTDGIYEAEVTAPNKAGKHDFIITGVVTSNGNTVEAPYTVTVDVLKDKPEIADFRIDSSKELPEISFRITDTDSAFEQGYFVVTDSTGTEKLKELISVNTTDKFTLRMDDGSSYNFKIVITYDQDNNYFSTDAAPDQKVTDEIIYDNDITFTRDFDFIPKDVALTEKVSADADLVLTFKNGYDSYYKVSTVVIDGSEFFVNGPDEKGVYSVVIAKSETKGINTVKVESVTLENNTSKYYPVDMELSYIYLKDAPVVDDIKAEITDNNLHIEIGVTDADEAVTNITVILTNKNGETIEYILAKSTSADITLEDFNEYTIEVKVDYTLGDMITSTVTKAYDGVIKQELKVTNISTNAPAYVNRGESVDITFAIEANDPNAVPDYILIDGEKLPLEKQGNGTYKVSLTASSERPESGIEAHTVTKVYFDGEEADTICRFRYEILKLAPAIVNDHIDDTNTPVLYFALIDDEDAFVSGRVIVTNTQDNTVNEYEFTKNTSDITLDTLEEFTKYKLEIELTYDLDNNKEDGENQYVETVKEYTIEILGDYEFTISNFRLKEITNNAVTLEFTSTNESDYTIQTVTINGKEYTAVHSGNIYDVTVPTEDFGKTRTELVLEKAVLENLKAFTEELAALDSVLVFKTAPTAVITGASVSSDKTSVIAHFNITDSDNAIIGGFAVLKQGDEIIAKVRIDENGYAELKSEKAEMLSAGDYTVEVIATYDAVDGIEHNNVSITGQSRTVTVDKYAVITSIAADNVYPEKGADVVFTFTVSTNTNAAVTAVEIGGSKYSVTKSGNTYKMTVKASEKAGIEELKVTKAYFADEETVVLSSESVKVDVLKDAPVINNGFVDTSAETPILRFDLNDPDNAFISGQIIVNGDDGSTFTFTFEKPENSSSVEIELSGVTENVIYTVSASVTYNRDSDAEDETNRKTEVLATSEFELINDYDFHISGFEPVSVDEEWITLKFTSENDSRYGVNSVVIGGTQYYTESKGNNEYIVKIPVGDIGEVRTELKLEKVTLSNLKAFEDELSGLDTVVVFKNHPNAIITNISVADTLNQINIDYTITDDDETITALYAVISDENGVYIKTAIDKDQTTASVTLAGGILTAGRYTVDIAADYDRADGASHSEEVITSVSSYASVANLTKVTSVEADKHYFNKGEAIVLTVKIDTNAGKPIQYIKLNAEDTLYVPEVLADGTYRVTAYAPYNAGVTNYEVVRVDFGDEMIAITDSASAEVEILKSEPTLDTHTIRIDDTAVTPVLSFEITDPDGAFISGKAIVKQDGTVVKEYAFDSIAPQIVLEGLNDSTAYTLDIEATYDLDSDNTNNENEYTAYLETDNEFNLPGESEFALSDYKIISVDSDTITLGFSVINTYGYPVSSVVINGSSYSVTGMGTDSYTVKVPASATGGVKTDLKLTEAVLANLKSFTFDDLSVTVFLDSPVVNEVTGSVSGDTITVTVDATDIDNTITNLYVTLTSYIDYSVMIQPATKVGDKYVAAFNPSKVDFYSAMITADYERLDGNIHSGEILYYEFYIEGIATVIDITEVNAPEFVKKNETFNVSFTVDGNTSFDVIAAKINGETASNLTKQGAGTYAARMTAPSDYGNISFGITELTFSNGETVTVTDALKAEIYVLRDAPTIGKYEFHDTLDIPEIVIRVDDPDETLLDENITLTISEVGGDYVRKVELRVNEETVITSEGLLRDDTRAGKFILTIDGLYDLDDDKNNIPNPETNTYNVRDILGEKEIEILEYEVQIENLAVQSVNAETNEVTVTFTAFNKNEQNIAHVLVAGEYYPAEGPDANGNYTATVPYTPNGDEKVTVTLEGVKLSNGKIIIDDNTQSFDIFLAPPTAEISGISLAENMLSITADISISDTDNTVTALYAVLKNAEGDEVAKKAISKADTSVTLSAGGTGVYTVEIAADYERLDGAEHTCETLATSDEIIIERLDILELKDITSASLYYGLEEVKMLDITNGIPEGEALQDYYVKIEMETLPAFYASVKEIKLENEKLIAIPDESVFMQYVEADGTVDELSFEISYKDKDGEHKLLGSAKELFDKIAKDLGGTYTLTEDLDASDIPESNVPIVNAFFTGTLDGAGHKIVNLNGTMFSRLYNGTVKNLIIEDAHVQANANKRGIIATSTSYAAKVDNVHIVNSSIEENTSEVIEKIGGFFGEIWETTKITNSSATNIKVKSDTQAGGIAGLMTSSAIIENCYVTGTIQATFDNPTWGARAAGIAAWDNSNGYIDHCYANVNIVVPNPIYSAGLVGGSDNRSTIVVKNSFAVNTGSARKVIGFDIPGDSRIENVWETNVGTGISSVDSAGKVRVTDDLYNKSFYQNTLGFNASIWNLDMVDGNILPNLVSDPSPKDKTAYEIMENANDIPNYSEVRGNESYDADKEPAYYNIAQIAPFLPVSEWIDIANGITHTNLTTEKIATILAFSNNGKLSVGIQDKDAESLSSIKVLYESGKSDEFDVTYLRTMGGLVAEYEIKDLGIKYQFDSYVAKLDDSLVDKLVGWAESYDYSKDIASTTSEEESRLYVDYYNETLKYKVEDAVINYLLTYTDYPVYFENSAIQQKIADSITENTVKRLLYAYNYYDKWYNINLDTVSLSDLLFFKGTVFGNDLTTKYLIDTLYNATAANRDTNGTYTYYNYALQSKTGKTLIEFLEYTFRVLDGYSDYNDWFIEHFKGIIVEQPSLSLNADEIDYRIWDLMSKSALGDRRRNILPILTAPQEDMYMISIPSQIVIGSLLRYNDWINGGDDKVEKMTEKIKNFGTQLGQLYGTMANLIEDSPTILNNHVHFQYDTRFDFPQSDKVAQGVQDSGTTQDPVVKWVYEAVKQLAAANGSGAYANGTDVWWVCYAALGGGDFTYFVFAHETAHNQDGYYFYDGKGRRVGTGPESHADDNYGMATGDESIMFNIFREYDFTEDISNNFSYTRIDSLDEIKDFYYDIFEAKYAIDYMMGEAFLNLTPEEQAKVAVKVSHTPEGRSFSTTYSRITAEEIEAMQLESIKDLMDNNLALHSVGTSPSAASGAYGQDSFFNVYWYQPFNNEGSPDAYTFRRNGREMLGIGGYMDGYVEYMSGNKTDLDALRIATKDPTITWEKYKMERFDRVASQLDSIPYFDHSETIALFEAALRTDAKTSSLNESTNLQKVLYGIVKRVTNDFTDGDFFNAPEKITEIRTAQELIEAMNNNPYGNYKLMQDIDFSNIAPAGGTYYVKNTFIGILDGDGYSIEGLQYPLCDSAAYAQFKNINLSAASYSFSANAYFAKTAKRSTVSGITVPDAEMMLPYFASKNVCYEYGRNSTAIAEHEIGTLDEFIAIGSSAENLKKRYILTDDLDFSTYNVATTSVIMNVFAGTLNGNGHTIKGLKNASLFASFQGTAENLIIKDFNNDRSGSSMVAAFAAESSNATFRNMYFDGITLRGWQNTAPLSGYDKSSVMEQITVVNTNVWSSGYYASALVARKSGGSINDCYVEGELNINSTQMGAVAGELMDYAAVENVIANVKITRRENGDNRNMSGGFVGSLYNNAAVTNSIAMGDMIATPDGSSVAWRFTASDYTMINSKISNCYELEGALGKSSINENVTTLREATQNQIHTTQFWRDTLKLSDSLWSFDTVTETGVPQLIHNGLAFD